MKNWKIFLLAALAACATQPAWSRALPPYVERLLGGDDAIVVTGTDSRESPVITLGRRFGGSVVSVFFRGVEYINNDNGKEVDYGRQLQSAVQYRGAGECFNPTEAGGRYDRGKPGSSSRLLSVERPGKNVIVTQSDMAFWMAPGETKTMKDKSCTALNTDYRGGHLLKRELRVGVEGFPNVIYYQTQFVAPAAEPNPRYEVVVIHTPPRFSRVFRITSDGQPQELNQRNQRGADPYMLATDDQLHAVVVCSATPAIDVTYGYIRWPNTTTSRFLHLGRGPEKESPVFDNYVVVGSAAEVLFAARKFCFAR